MADEMWLALRVFSDNSEMQHESYMMSRQSAKQCRGTTGELMCSQLCCWYVMQVTMIKAQEALPCKMIVLPSAMQQLDLPDNSCRCTLLLALSYAAASLQVSNVAATVNANNVDLADLRWKVLIPQPL